MLWLRQSTSVTVAFGPGLDITDGVTPETSLATAMDNASTGIRVSKNGGNLIDRNSGTAPVHDEVGWYGVNLSTADTDTLGALQILFSGATVNLPIWMEFMIVPANVWDSLFGADVLQTDVTQWLGTAAATPTVAGVPEVDVTHMAGGVQTVTDLKDFADAGYDPGTNKIQGVVLVDTTTANSDMRGTDSAALASVATEARLAELDAANLPTDIAAIPTTAMRGTDSAALASVLGAAAGADIATDIAAVKAETALVVADTNELQTDDIPTLIAAVETKVDTVDTVVDGILVDTAEIGVAGAGLTVLATQASVNTVDSNVDAILVDTGTTLPATLATIEADTNELQTDDVPGLIAALNDVAATDIVSAGAITTLSGAVVNVDLVDTITTYTGNTLQTGDTFALANGATGFTAIDTVVDTILADTADMQPKLGTPAADIAADVAAVKVDTGNLATRITSTLFTGITSLAEWLGLMAGNQVADSTALTEVKASGAGSGTYDESTDSLEAIAGAGGGGAPTVAQIRTEMDSNSTQLAAIVADTGELQTDWANTGRLDTILDTAASGGSAPTAAAIRTEIDSNSTQLAAIVEDTGTTIPGTITTLQATADAIPTTAMRGTDSAALASVATEARLAELDAANIPADIDAIPTTAMRGTDNSATASVLGAAVGASISADIAAVKAETALVVADTNELQADDYPTLIAAVQTVVDAIPTTAMRGTDSAATAASVAALNDVAATDIVSAGAITTLTGAVVNVDSVDTIALAGRVLVANQVWANDITTWEGVADSAAYAINNSDNQSAAAVSALTTAQADLDKLTGSDGATLATSQANYAPATATSLSTVSTTIGAAGAGLTEAGGTGDHLTAMPWNAAWDAEVESEVNDAIDTAINELSVAAPTATPTLRTGLMLLYMALRNKLVVQTSGTDALELYNDAGIKIASKAITDDTSDYTEAEMS